jgi:hypothetical protein
MQLHMDACAFTFRSWNETLDALSLGTYVFTSYVRLVVAMLYDRYKSSDACHSREYVLMLES